MPSGIQREKDRGRGWLEVLEVSLDRAAAASACLTNIMANAWRPTRPFCNAIAHHIASIIKVRQNRVSAMIAVHLLSVVIVANRAGTNAATSG
jgi:translation initiation factor 2B subunit (eIF-2B alpha/beta/delta family)